MLVYVYQTAVKVLFDITVSHVAWLSHEDLNAVQDLQWFIVSLSVFVSDWRESAVGYHCVTCRLVESWRPQCRARLAVIHCVLVCVCFRLAWRCCWTSLCHTWPHWVVKTSTPCKTCCGYSTARNSSTSETTAIRLFYTLIKSYACCRFVYKRRLKAVNMMMMMTIIMMMIMIMTSCSTVRCSIRGSGLWLLAVPGPPMSSYCFARCNTL